MSICEMLYHLRRAVCHTVWQAALRAENLLAVSVVLCLTGPPTAATAADTAPVTAAVSGQPDAAAPPGPIWRPPVYPVPQTMIALRLR